MPIAVQQQIKKTIKMKSMLETEPCPGELPQD